MTWGQIAWIVCWAVVAFIVRRAEIRRRRTAKAVK